MKSVLRSCFDPLPRFMSMKSLAAVVTLLLVGTTISVLEYLESSSVPPRRSSYESGAVQAADSYGDLRSSAQTVPAATSPSAAPRCAPETVAPETVKCRVPRPSALSAPAPCSESESQARTAPPTLFQPEAGSVGG
jgi:hypothetical protein